MPKEVYYKEIKTMDTHLTSWFSYICKFLFIYLFFKNELFCVCFDFDFWLLYLICECVDFFN